jgi:hypothetical protein
MRVRSISRTSLYELSRLSQHPHDAAHRHQVQAEVRRDLPVTVGAGGVGGDRGIAIPMLCRDHRQWRCQRSPL